jgi:hypothetical protein
VHANLLFFNLARPFLPVFYISAIKNSHFTT